MDKVHKKVNAKASVKLGDVDYTPALIALAVVLFTLVVLFLLKRKKTHRSDLLLTGLCDSGKTCLFSQLILGEGRETFTSIKENVGHYRTAKGELRIVDVPGHERLRAKFFDQYKNCAKAIAFIVDSVTVQKDIRDVADFLYSILSDKATANLPVMIVCNKQDETLAKGEGVIKSLLEKEMNLVRQTRKSQLESVDNSASTTTFLGRSDRDFEFGQLSQKVTFLHCSVQENEYEDLTNLLEAL